MTRETPPEHEKPVGEVPADAVPSAAAVHLFTDYLRRLEIDPDSDFESFRGENAAHSADLTRLLTEYERVSGILEQLTPTASFSARLRQHYGEGVDPGISLSGEGGGQRPKPSTGTGSRPSDRMLSRLAAQNPSTTRYDLRREIARGGMGAIMEVWDKELRRTLAMKVVLGSKTHADSSQSSEEVAERRLSRFLEEAQITGQLDHPGIVPVHDIGLDDDARVFFTMQLIDGSDLRKVFGLARLRKEGWNERRVVSLLVRVCEAMAYAHSKAVVHRDLKPANIMVGAFGEVYVMDWGLAKVLGSEEPPSRARSADEGEGGGDEPDSDSARRSARVATDRSDSDSPADDVLRTLDGDIVGTPAYMAPEQARGKLEEVGSHSDIYSVGAMLYHLITGHAPYEPLGEKVAAHVILDAVRKGPPWPLRELEPDVDGELAAICEKAMSREPSARYESMMALGEDLRNWVEGRGVRAYTTGALYQMRKWIARNRALAGALLTIPALMLVSIVLFIYLQQSNLSKVTEEKANTEAARLAAEEAQGEADRSANQARENERRMAQERDRADREAQDAKDQKERADTAAETARQQSELARLSARQAEGTAYRASLNAAAYSLRLNDAEAARRYLDVCKVSMRGWEWDHLDVAVDSSIGSSIVQEEGVTDLAVSADGSVVLTYGMGLRPRLWEPETKRQRKDFDFRGSVVVSGRLELLNCALSPDGGIVAVTEHSVNAVAMINAYTGDGMYSFNEHSRPVTCVRFSPDGSLTATASLDGTAVVFNTLTARVKHEFVGHVGEVLGVAFSPDGKRLATCGSDRTARIWDVQTGELLVTLGEHHTSWVLAVDWSPDGRRVVTASRDGSLAVWDPVSGGLTAVMHGHSGVVRDALFSEDGSTVFSGGEDRTVRQWDASTGRIRRVFHGHGAEVRGLGRLPGNRIVSASLDKTTRVWDAGWDPALTEFPAIATNTYGTLAFSPDNRTVLAVSPEKRIDRLDAELAAVGEPVVPTDPAAARGTERRVVALAPAAGVYAIARGDRKVELHDADGGFQLLEGFDQSIAHLALSNDGSRLAVGASRGMLQVIDLSSLERVEIVLRYSLVAIALSPDGGRLATAENDESLRLWDAATGATIGSRRDAHSSRVNELAFSSDGRVLGSASRDRTARLWALPELELLGPELKDHGDSVTAILFSPEAGRVVTGSAGGSVRVWSADTRELLLEFKAHPGPVRDLAFSPDGARLASSGLDGGVRVWESETDPERYGVRRSQGSAAGGSDSGR